MFKTLCADVGETYDMLPGGDLPLAIEIAAGYIVTYDEFLAEYVKLLQHSPLGQALELDKRRRMRGKRPKRNSFTSRPSPLPEKLA